MTLLEFLMRGGTHGHYWLKQSKRTIWWPTDNAPPIPQLEEDIYFGVHPSKITKGPSERTTEEDIAAINCLYADVDSKDHGSKEAASAHVQSMHPRPSVIIDSGNGYHCYWLLDEPFPLDTPTAFRKAKTLQEKWVTFVGGDKAVHDLARILRLPGTFNYKYSPPRPIVVRYASFERTYSLNDLAAQIGEHRAATTAPPDKPLAVFPNDVPDEDLARRAARAKGGAKFVRLWKGEDEGYASTSEADLALCCLLAYWTGGDYDRIASLFARSGRMRDKWNREDYRHKTVMTALEQVTEYYTPRGGYLTEGATDEGNAQCVLADNPNKFLYCPAFGWMRFVGTHWATGLTESTLERTIVETLRKRRNAAWGTPIENPDSEKGLELIRRAAKPSASNVRNCKMLFKSLVPVGVEEFDRSPDELNCANGILDLRTGELAQQTPSRRFSYCLPINYNPNADRTPWTEFLSEAVGDDQGVMDFLQQAIGYSLTGHTREELMFYIYGPARAGKGVFTETLLAMLGGAPLATEVNIEMFLVKRGGSSQNFDLAGLKSTRFIAASETGKGTWMNSSRLKSFTGGNDVRCANKYQSFFTYRPQFKIWLTSNWQPQLDPDDTAAWGRVQVVNFPKSYLKHEDKTLKGRMRSPEVLEGILAWAVEGAMKWYGLPKGGLRTPEAVEVEIKHARDLLDWVAKWLEDRIVDTGRDEDLLFAADYYPDYKDWALERGAPVKKQSGLNKALRSKGFRIGVPTYVEGKTRRCWVGAMFKDASFRQRVATLAADSDIN